MRSAPAVFALALTLVACGKDAPVTQPVGVTPVLTALGVSAPGNTLAVGATMQLSTNPVDQNGVPFQTVVTWGSGSTFVATVTSGGLVKGIAAGQAYLFAHGGSLTDSTLITVLAGAYPATAAVYMLPQSYSPVQTDIAVGGTVQFVFPSLGHNVFFNATGGAPADIPGEVSNQTVSRTFSVTGSFVYNCTIHPGMTGTIVVH
jgi:plastocyanin